MNNLEVRFGELDFNGNLIQLTQSTGFDMMVNATEMAKPFGKYKRPSYWFRLPSTIEYLDLLKSDVQFSNITPVLTIKGNYSDGTRQGTWMHRWVAIRYAQWLDPRFAIWIDQKIDELLQNGFTTALQEERDRYNAALPKINFCNQVLQTSENLYSTEQLCKDMNLKISNRMLINALVSNNLAYRRQDGKWFLARAYDKYNYLKTVTIVDKTGKPRNVRRWTEAGRYWIWSIKNELGL